MEKAALGEEGKREERKRGSEGERDKDPHSVGDFNLVQSRPVVLKWG